MNNNSPKPLTVALTDLTKAGWTAGGRYLANLLTALAATYPGDEVRTLLLRADGAGPNDLDGLAGRVVLMDPPAAGGLAGRVRDALARRGMAPPPPSPMGARLRREGADCLFAAGEYGPRLGVPLVAWIPDFQHLHLPEMFSAAELRRRDEALTRIADRADRIVLSSQDALQDLGRFNARAAAKGRVLHFAAQPPAFAPDDDPAWVCARYHLPERFIYLPNQFWAHKNHGLVLDALELLSRTRPEIAVVCTGNTSDSRNPHFFGELLARISARGLRERIIMLGLVEHDHVFHLMRQCLAVLQPSLFEGWSTTVEEVKSLGKRILVSDIPVHREQDPPGALFFDPRDAADLARRLEEVYDVCAPGPDREMEAAAARNLPARTQDFAQKFLAVIREAVG